MVIVTVRTVNAERDGGGRPERYEGVFETHLTLEPDGGEGGAERVRAWAARHGLKYTHILLDRGRTPNQPMLTWQGRGTLPAQLAEARRRADRLRGDGFRVIRVKIEAAPWNTGVPQTDAEAAALPEDRYFEHHVKLALWGEAEVTGVRELAVAHAAHVSRNARRAAAAGRHERFVTQRCRGVGGREAGRRLDALLGSLAGAGHTVLEVEREFVVHDDNLAVDAGWMGEAGPGRENRGDGGGRGRDAGAGHDGPRAA